MRQGDFSELLDPVTKLPFDNNVIPTSRLSPNGVGLLKSYPAPAPGFAPAGSTANFYEAVPAIRNYAKELVKVDCVPNAYNDSNMWGVANQHREYMLIANYVYDLPFLRSVSSWYGKAFGGWQLSGIIEAQSGSPLNTGDQIFGAGWRVRDQAGVGAGNSAQPYNLVGDWKLSDQKFSMGPSKDQTFWFNNTAFAAPTAGTSGNVGRNLILGPNSWNWDMSLVKKFRFSEEKSFQVRADFLNFPNHPNWNNPEGNPSSSNFGRITGKGGSRQIQVTATIRF